MKRRGYTAEGISDFCDVVSVTRSGNENFISFGLLEHCVRHDLEFKAKRTMAVIDPVPVHIINVNDVKTVEAPDFPLDPKAGSHSITFSKDVFVERSDVMP
jgi:glutaminyl-tRNA synthetase